MPLSLDIDGVTVIVQVDALLMGDFCLDYGCLTAVGLPKSPTEDEQFLFDAFTRHWFEGPPGGPYTSKAAMKMAIAELNKRSEP